MESGAAPEREEIYSKISRDHWERVEAAHDAAGTVRENFEALASKYPSLDLDLPNIEFWVTTSHSKNGGYEKQVRAKRIRDHRRVKREDGEGYKKEIYEPPMLKRELESSLPSTIEGTVRDTQGNQLRTKTFPVIVEEVDIERRGCERYYYEDDYAKIPGGARIEPGGDQNLDPRAATVCTPAHDDDSDTRRMVTAGHCFKPTAEDYQNIYQPTNNDFTVEGKQVDEKTENADGYSKDYGLIKSPDNKSGTDKFSYKLASDDGGYKQDMTIDGIISWNTIKYAEGRDDYTISCQGARTGTDTGRITGVNEEGKRLYTNIAGDGGDSGGPFFKTHLNRDDSVSVSIVGMHTYGETGTGCPNIGSYGHSMEYLENEMNLVV